MDGPQGYCGNMYYTTGKIISALAQRIQHVENEEEKQKKIRKFDKLDDERLQYMTAADNYASKPPPNGIYEWSPAREKSGKRVHIENCGCTNKIEKGRI